MYELAYLICVSIEFVNTFETTLDKFLSNRDIIYAYPRRNSTNRKHN